MFHSQDKPAGQETDSTSGEYLTTFEAADFLRLSVSTLAKLRMSGAGPEYLKLGRRKILYSRSILIGWLRTHRRRNTSQSATNV